MAQGSTYTVIQQTGVVSTVNSTSTPLGISATFTGTWEDISGFASIEVIGSTDQIGTLYFDFSTDGTNVDRAVQLSSGLDSSLGIHGLTPVSKYGRVRAVNSTVAETYLLLQTIYHTSGKVALPTSRIGQTLGQYSDMLNTRTVLVGNTQGGDYFQNILSDGAGSLEVSIQNPTTAFGELATSEPLPVAQIDFVYGVNNITTITALTGSGAVTGVSGMVKCDTTAATSSSATLRSSRYLKYRPGQGGKAMFTAIFTSGAAGSTQYAGLFTPNLNNGFGFGYSGTAFGIWYNKGGVQTHIPKASWSNDVMDGAKGSTNKSGMLLDPTKGNVFKVVYQYLGFGGIKFYVENSANGRYVLVHEIKYANSDTTPSITQPSLNILWSAQNTTNNTAIAVYGSSGALFLEGYRQFLGPSFGGDNTKSTITTETNIFTVRNATNYNTVSNRAQIRLRTVTFASNTGGSGSGITTLKIRRNATLGGTPAYTATNGTTADNGVTITAGNSVSSYDTAGTTVTGGSLIFNSIVGVGNNSSHDLTGLDLYSNPGDTLTFSITSTQSITAGVGITWTEDI